MPFSTRCMEPSDWVPLEPYFKPEEFNHPEKLGAEFMEWLLQVRLRAGVPMVVSSDWRDPARKVGAKDSAHGDVPCDSVDIRKPTKPNPADPNWNYARWRIVNAAIELGCRRIGIYPNGSLHIDRTEHRRPHPRLWVMVDNPAA